MGTGTLWVPHNELGLFGVPNDVRCLISPKSTENSHRTGRRDHTDRQTDSGNWRYWPVGCLCYAIIPVGQIIPCS